MTAPRERTTTPRPPDEERAAKLGRLKAENAQLHQALESHAVIDQAIGILIALYQLSAEDGWAVLREVSQHTNTKLRQIADQVIGGTQGHPVPEPVGQELHEALHMRRHCGEV